MTLILLVTVVSGAFVALATGAGDTLVYPVQEPGVLPLVLFTGVFAAAIPSLAFLTGIRWIGGLRAGILMLFEPVVGVALAALLLSEGLQPIQVAGGIAILAAAIIVQRSSHGEPAVEPAATPVSDDDAAVGIAGAD
jgi:drug/metabolite transporter (DMT)-like permease